MDILAAPQLLCLGCFGGFAVVPYSMLVDHLIRLDVLLDIYSFRTTHCFILLHNFISDLSTLLFGFHYVFFCCLHIDYPYLDSIIFV